MENYSPSFSAIVDYAGEYTASGVVGYRSVIVGYYIAMFGTYRCGPSFSYERAAFLNMAPFLCTALTPRAGQTRKL